MPRKRFAFKPKGKPRLEIRREGGLFLADKYIEILFDHEIVKTFPKKADLEKPRRIKLRDGSVFTVQLEGRNNFKVLRNGKLLEASSLPEQNVNTFANIFIVLGLFISIFRGLMLEQKDNLMGDWILWSGILGGAALFIFGVAIRRRYYWFFGLGILAFLVEFAIILDERYLQNLDIGLNIIIGFVVLYLMISAARKAPEIKGRPNG